MLDFSVNIFHSFQRHALEYCHEPGWNSPNRFCSIKVLLVESLFQFYAKCQDLAIVGFWLFINERHRTVIKIGHFLSLSQSTACGHTRAGLLYHWEGLMGEGRQDQSPGRAISTVSQTLRCGCAETDFFLHLCQILNLDLVSLLNFLYLLTTQTLSLLSLGESHSSNPGHNSYLN